MIREPGGSTMLDIARGGLIGRRDRIRQHITGKQPREMGRAPDITASGGITRAIDPWWNTRHQPCAQRTERATAAAG